MALGDQTIWLRPPPPPRGAPRPGPAGAPPGACAPAGAAGGEGGPCAATNVKLEAANRASAAANVSVRMSRLLIAWSFGRTECTPIEWQQTRLYLAVIGCTS